MAALRIGYDWAPYGICSCRQQCSHALRQTPISGAGMLIQRHCCNEPQRALSMISSSSIHTHKARQSMTLSGGIVSSGSPCGITFLIRSHTPHAELLTSFPRMIMALMQCIIYMTGCNSLRSAHREAGDKSKGKPGLLAAYWPPNPEAQRRHHTCSLSKITASRS